VLVIDDVHFLASKPATQQEFQHTFNALDQTQSSIVMASDSHPKMISQMKQSLVARFVSGLVVQLVEPDYETRRAIVRAKLGQRLPAVNEGVVEYIARGFVGSVREIEGAVNTLVACSVLGRRRLTPQFAREVLRSLLPHKIAPPTLEAVGNAVADFYGLSAAELHSARRTRRISWPRHIAMYLGRELTGASFSEIAAHFGGKNHSTAVFAHSKVTGELGGRPELAGELKELRSRVGGSSPASSARS
jgi:chromosomal replication initiator protein